MWADFVSIIEKYGYWGLILVFFSALLYSVFDKVLSKWIDKWKTSPEVEINLDNNLFFVNSKYRLAVDIPNLDWPHMGPVRKKILKDLMKLKVKVFIEVCSEIIQIDMNDMDNEEWISTVLEKYNNIATRFSMYASAEGIPEVVVEKFSSWSYATMELLRDHVTTLGHNKGYANHQVRTDTLLMIMDLLVLIIIGHAEKTLFTLNGEITGLKYNGLTIE